MNLVGISARNLKRSYFRTIMTIAGAVVAIVTFVMLRTVLTTWHSGVSQAAQDRVATRHKISFVIPMPLNYAETIRQIPGVTGASFMNWFGARDPKFKDDFYATMAVDTDTFFEVFDEVKVPEAQQRAWKEDRQGAIIGDQLAKKLGYKVGDTINLEGTIFPGDWQFHVSGIYTTTRNSAVDRSSLLFHWKYLNEGAEERMKNQIGWITSRVADPTKGPEVCKAIDAVFDSRDTQTATMSERAMNLSFLGMFAAMIDVIEIVSYGIMVIMLLILGNTISMAVRERTREFGVLRALGFLPKHVAMFVLGEALTLGLLAAAVGLPMSYLLVERGMGRVLEENVGMFFPTFRIEWETYVVAGALGILLAVVGAALPARNASRLRITDSLRRVA